MKTSLRDKDIVVLGGSSGIGLSVGAIAASYGANVVLIARSREKLEQAKASVPASVVVADMANQDELQGAIESVSSIEHLIITAGEFALGPILETPPDRMRPILEDRFWGTYNAIRFAAPRMPSSGSITLTSGVLGWRPAEGAAVTAAGVAAIEALTRVAALELAPIRVNAVCPGLIDTPMLDVFGDIKNQVISKTAHKLPVRRIGNPEEVADSYIYLMTNGFTTGTVLRIDGGAGVV